VVAPQDVHLSRPHGEITQASVNQQNGRAATFSTYTKSAPFAVTCLTFEQNVGTARSSNETRAPRNSIFRPSRFSMANRRASPSELQSTDQEKTTVPSREQHGQQVGQSPNLSTPRPRVREESSAVGDGCGERPQDPGLPAIPSEIQQETP
jgi:hypothetical protein